MIRGNRPTLPRDESPDKSKSTALCNSTDSLTNNLPRNPLVQHSVEFNRPTAGCTFADQIAARLTMRLAQNRLGQDCFYRSAVNQDHIRLSDLFSLQPCFCETNLPQPILPHSSVSTCKACCRDAPVSEQRTQVSPCCSKRRHSIANVFIMPSFGKIPTAAACRYQSYFTKI